jgi:hypothetical protein
VPIFLKSGSLNLLEPSGSVQACNGIAIPLPYLYKNDALDQPAVPPHIPSAIYLCTIWPSKPQQD